DELVLVRRVYVVPPSWDTPGSQTVIAEPELWCISCISQYPCEIVDDRATAAPTAERVSSRAGDRAATGDAGGSTGTRCTPRRLSRRPRRTTLRACAAPLGC